MLKSLSKLILIILTFVITTSMYANNSEETHKKYTYVLVHGSSGGGWDWKGMDDLLSSRGHKVYRPTLTGLGEKMHLSNPDINLTTHVTDVVNHILFENMENVILVGHSYGGMVITGVMDRIPGRIKHAIFLDATVPNHGNSAQDLFGAAGPKYKLKEGIMHFSWLRESDPIPRDVPQSLKTYNEPVSFNNPDALKLPATYIAFIKNAEAVKKRKKSPSWINAKARHWTIRTLISDHNAQRSHRIELADLLEISPNDKNTH